MIEGESCLRRNLMIFNSVFIVLSIYEKNAKGSIRLFVVEYLSSYAGEGESTNIIKNRGLKGDITVVQICFR